MCMWLSVSSHRLVDKWFRLLLSTIIYKIIIQSHFKWLDFTLYCYFLFFAPWILLFWKYNDIKDFNSIHFSGQHHHVSTVKFSDYPWHRTELLCQCTCASMLLLSSSFSPCLHLAEAMSMEKDLCCYLPVDSKSLYDHSYQHTSAASISSCLHSEWTKRLEPSLTFELCVSVSGDFPQCQNHIIGCEQLFK